MISLEKLLGAALEDHKAFSTLYHAITDDLVVQNPHYLAIMQWVSSFYQSYGSLPSDQDAHTWILTQNENRQSPLRSAWSELTSQDLDGYNLDFLAETGLNELKKIAARNASHLMASMGDQVDSEILSDFSERVNRIEPVELSGLVDLSEYSTWAVPNVEDVTYWTSGIPKLDSYIRGFGNELIFVLAESGKGKSTLLINFAQAAAREGAKVLHISFELNLHATAQRYYRRIAEATKGQYVNEMEEVHRKLNRYFKFARGSIHAIYQPAYSMTVNGLASFVELFAERNDGVDYIILDYMDLLQRTRQQERLPRDEQERRISHEVRAVGQEYNASILSAAQANLLGYGKESLGMRHMGGGVAKNQAADVILGLVQTEDEEGINQGRLCVLKVREDPGKGAEIPLHIDLDRMVMMDLDDPDARRLRSSRRRNIHG